MVPENSVAAAFAARTTVEQVEEGLALAPGFDTDGLIPCITTGANTGDVLMPGSMNGEARERSALLEPKPPVPLAQGRQWRPCTACFSVNEEKTNR